MILAVGMLPSPASADQLRLSVGTEPFSAGSANKLLVYLVNDVRRQGLQFDLAYDPTIAEPVRVEGIGRVHEPVQLYHSVSPPGVLHVVVYDPSGECATLDAGADAIACVTFGIPEAVSRTQLRVSSLGGMAASGSSASAPIPSMDIVVPVVASSPLAERGRAPPSQLALYQNSPNPSAGGTLIRFDVPQQSRIRLAIYDVLGRLVRVLRDGEMPPGRYSAFWDSRRAQGDPAPNGIYVYVVQMGRQSIARKAILSQ